VIILAMVAGGIGIGLLLPNLTLFAQASAPRTQLGIATAMLQSTRMIGSMLGTALSGALVHHVYVRNVDGRLRDPQILVDHGLAMRFVGSMSQTGQDGLALLSGARQALVHAIHISQWVVLLMLVSAWIVAWRTPRLSLHGDITPSVEPD
jgi:MFS family permease